MTIITMMMMTNVGRMQKNMKKLVDVLDLYREDTFENLFRKLYTDEEEIMRKTKSMYNYSSPEEEKEYGVLGIKIKLKI